MFGYVRFLGVFPAPMLVAAGEALHPQMGLPTGENKHPPHTEGISLLREIVWPLGRGPAPQKALPY